MEVFLSEMLLCFPLLGAKFFEMPAKPKKANQSHVYHLRQKGIEARGYETGNGFVVSKGSTCVVHETPSCPDYLKEIRKNLLRQGILVKQSNAFTFIQDHLFDSPSGASGAVLGASSNGVTSWKTKEEKTLKNVRESESK